MSIPNFNRALKTTTSKISRGEDNKQTGENVTPVTVGLLTIDTAILQFLQNKITPVVTQDNKQIKVPVIYGNPERWKSVQLDGSIRDSNGKIQLPIMMLRRTSMKKNSTNSPVNKYQEYVFKAGWNSRNIYDKFTALNGITPSQVYNSVTVPDFYDITYEAMVWTEYMEQMNKIIESVSFESDEYWGESNNYRFITRINQFDQTNDLPNTSDRLVRNRFVLDVKAYILPESALNRDGNRSATTRLSYSPKKVVFNTEIITDLTKR